MKHRDLLAKYNKPVPRYTSYPTVPFWNKTPTQEEWLDSLNTHLVTTTPWTMYIHIPFCETLCSYCGCNTIITKDHRKLDPYLELIKDELEIYLKNVSHLNTAPLTSLHFGGGSPSFISPKQMDELLAYLYKHIHRADNFSGSIELDPRRVKKTLIQTLAHHDINRISFGVQDFNYEVQACLNRVQPYEVTEQAVAWCRELGIKEINFDLIYGLPKQNLEAMKYTIDCTLRLKPDRIALYSLAMVPWQKKQQNLIKERDLPTVEQKRELYDYARTILLNNGYIDIGMDHFSLPNDTLNIAKKNKVLHRNFMGYTEHKTDVLLGLGVSSISETPNCFHQNQKVLPKYQEYIRCKNLATMRGHILSERDQTQRIKILKFMTQLQIDLEMNEVIDAKKELENFLNDGIIEINNNTLKLTRVGEPFLRNVTAFFDDYLKSSTPAKPIFSKSI